MSYKDSAGNTLTKAQMLALATAGTAETPYTFNQDVYQTFTYDGARPDRFEGGSKLMIPAGKVVGQSTIDALYKLATVTTISPATVLVAGGTAVTINGTNLAGNKGVQIGGVAATNVVVVSNAKITCTAPAHAAGAVNVVVNDDGGDVTVTNGVTYA